MRVPARQLLPVLGLALLLPGALPAQGASWACRTDSLSNYNCAQYYSGTVSLNSSIKTPDGTMTRSMVATVTGGKVSCRVEDSEAGSFVGPGMLAVEHAAAQSAGGEYEISVWCPAAEGERPTRNDAPAIQVLDQRAASYGTLEGKDSYPHAESDEVNGISGTETVTWRLRRER